MNTDEIPKAILEKHPELIQIAEALEAHREGRAISTKCASCGQVLSVTEVKVSGGLWVTCSTGCTNYRARSQPKTPT